MTGNGPLKTASPMQYMNDIELAVHAAETCVLFPSGILVGNRGLREPPFCKKHVESILH